MSDTLFEPPPSVVPFFLADEFVNLIVGPVGCLAGDTLVVTEFGPIPIADIDRPMRVLSWNERTCQFQMSQSSVSFPKGTDYLYRVSTPQGEFDASGSHQLLCADGVYRRVADIQAASDVKTCSDNPLLTNREFYLSALRGGVQNYPETSEGCQGGYVTSDRLDGLLALGVQEGVLKPVPLHSDARTYNRRFVLHEPLPLSDLQVELLARIRSELSSYLLEIDGCQHLIVPPQIAEVDRTSSVSCEYDVDYARADVRSPLMKGLRSLKNVLLKSVRGLALALRSPSLTTSDRPILAITRKHTKEIYWDIQVNDTHNYVTVDGAIHHNSTKTTAAIMKVAYEAARVHPCTDGIRRSRCAIIRNTNQMLDDTTIPDFLKWFPEGDAGSFLRTGKKFILRFDDVECEVIFRGLDDQNDVRRLLSLQLSFAVMDEFREIHPDIFDALRGRIGRYPDKSMNGVGCSTQLQDGSFKQIDKIWGATNPPDMETFWEEYINDPPSNASVTIQPSGLSPEADWIKYLKDGYYENLCEGASEEWIDVYVHAKFGKSLAGRPVFRSFVRDFHVAKAPLKPILNGMRPVIIGMDFGLNPSAVCMQLDARGRLMIYSALTSDGMGVTRFIDNNLKPHLAQKFPGAPILVVGDPAGKARSQTDERTVYDILKLKGFKAIEASTNSPVARIAAVDAFLNRQVDGDAGVLIDPEDCKPLVKALAGRYRYKKRKDGELDDSPEKNEASHICFSAGTLISVPGGARALETIRVGDHVSTPIGARRVLFAGVTQRLATTTTYRLSNGGTINATPDHPVLTQRGWIPIDAVQYSDVCLHVSNFTRSVRWSLNTQFRFLKAYAFIGSSLALLVPMNIWRKHVLPLRCGMGQKKGSLGTKSMENAHGRTEGRLNTIALTADNRSTLLSARESAGSAPPHVSLTPDAKAGLMTQIARALFAEKFSGLISTQKQKHVLRIVGKQRCPEVKPVYGLSVEDAGAYFVEGLLVSNCDALQYGCLHAEAQQGGKLEGTRRRVIKRVAAHGWT